jgi:hypothetical protein
LTYKCFACSRLSRPGETGIGPLSWFTARSSQLRLERLPIEAGIGPLKSLLFRDLQLNSKR